MPQTTNDTHLLITEGEHKGFMLVMEYLSELMSSIEVSLQIAFAIVFTSTLVVLVWHMGSRFGAPIGAILYRLVSPLIEESSRRKAEQHHREGESSALDRETWSQRLGASFALCLCYVTMNVEFALAELGEAGGASWSVWRVEGLLLKACLEAVMVLLLLRGVLALLP